MYTFSVWGGNSHNLNECRCLLYTSLCTLSIILCVQMLVKASTAPWLTRPLVWRPLVCLGWPWLLNWTEPREICPRNQTSGLLWWQQRDSQSRQTSLPGDRKTVDEKRRMENKTKKAEVLMSPKYSACSACWREQKVICGGVCFSNWPTYELI